MMPIDLNLLDALLRAPEPMAVHALSQKLGTTPAQVVQALETLLDAGCRITRHPQQGARLIETGLPVWQDYLAWSLAQPHRRIEVYRETASTQDLARRLIRARARGGYHPSQGDGTHGGSTHHGGGNGGGESDMGGDSADGAIVVAGHQTAGRGRLGRRWHAPPGQGLTFSRVRLIRSDPQAAIERLSLASAVAVARTLETLAHEHHRSLDINIKWPNDIRIGQRKLAGILVETADHHAIIGIGINVSLRVEDVQAADAALTARITSLHAAGCHVDRLRVLALCNQQLDATLDLPDAALLDAWRKRCRQLGRTLTVQQDGRVLRGQVVDLDPAAGLVLRLDQGQLLHLPGATTTVIE